MNIRRIALTVCSVLLLLAMVAGSRASEAYSKISIGAGDAGKTVSLHQGDILVVTLNVNTTTGYNWLMQSMDPAILKRVGEPVYTPETNQAGAQGEIVITFQAVKTGQANLILNYMRSFEKDTEPINTFEVTVVVK
ncbi:MAG: protease inhibitor I42 family protein [Anaerolineales bacterium]